MAASPLFLAAAVSCRLWVHSFPCRRGRFLALQFLWSDKGRLKKSIQQPFQSPLGAQCQELRERPCFTAASDFLGSLLLRSIFCFHLLLLPQPDMVLAAGTALVPHDCAHATSRAPAICTQLPEASQPFSLRLGFCG